MEEEKRVNRVEEEEDEEGGRGFEILKLALSGVMLILSAAINFGGTAVLILRICAAVVSGYEIVIKSVRNLFGGEFFDENTLMLIAFITAFILGDSLEGVIIVLLYNLGELLEDIATDNSRDKIAGLAELKSFKANLLMDGKVSEVPPESVKVGSLILVRKGDRVPIDGKVVKGCADFDLKAITGESRLKSVGIGDSVYGGAVNLGDAVVIITEKPYRDSAVERIIRLVEDSSERKAKSQKFITAFAKIYTPLIVFCAIVLSVLPPLFDGYNFAKWIYKALNFLIVACPCALVISVPLGFFIGIGALAKRGILVKGSNYIDALASTKVAVFDKTGTLTTGEFSVSEIRAKGGYKTREILKIAASVEQGSSHPIAKAIFSANGQGVYEVSDVKEISGKGVSGVINGARYAVGGNRILNVANAEKDKNNSENTVFVVKDSEVIGEIFLNDSVKKESARLIKDLRAVGVENTYILSGDGCVSVDKAAKEIGVSKAYGELLPEQKAEKIIEIIKGNKRGKVLFCGDGINDAPSIAAAEIGVAMGALGSEAAIETADVIITDDNPLKIPYAIKKSKLIKRKVLTNVISALGIKFLILILSLFMPLPIWLAMLGDVGVMLLAVLNSLTISLYK